MRIEPLDLVIILAVALLIFGPRRLPEIAKGFGGSIREFRDALAGRHETPKASAPEREGSPNEPPAA